MPVLDRILIALAGLLVMVGLAGAVYIEHQRNDALEDKVVTLTAEATASKSALDAYMTSAAASKARAATNQTKVNNALQANPDWTVTRVPDDVWSSLFDNRPRASTGLPASDVPGASGAK